MKTIVAHNASPILGGGEIWLWRLLVELQRRGHRVLLLCKTDEIAAHASAFGIPTETFSIGGTVAFGDAIRFALRLRRAQADVVLLTTFSKVWLGGIAAHLAQVPHVVARVAVSTITPRHVFYRLAIRRLLDAVIVNAEEIRQTFLRIMPRLEPHRIVTIHDGIEEPTTDKPREVVRRELGLAPNAQVIGTLARLSRQKRLQRLIHALTQLPHNVHCIVAGEGPEEQPLRAIAAELRVRERVHFIGFRDDVRSVLNALDVFVLSSDWEGLANSMLEAMCVGLPVVTTRVSGANVALQPDSDGVVPGIVVGFDDGELAAALRMLLADENLRARMGATGRARVQQQFGFGRMVDEWEQILRLAPPRGVA